MAAFAAVALFIESTIVGGAISPGYSHLADSVGELTNSMVPHRWGIAWGFAAYNVAFAVMALALWRAVRRSTASLVGMMLWFVIAAAGVGMVTAFPQDPVMPPTTWRGAVNVALAVLAAFGPIASAFVWSRAFRADPEWAPLARRTFWFGWALFMVRCGGAALGASVPALFGLGERLTVLTSMSWLAWLGVQALARRSERP